MARRWIPLLLLLVGGLLAALSTVWPNLPSEANAGNLSLRALEPEEREEILFDLARLRDESPALTQASSELESRLQRPELPTQVEILTTDDAAKLVRRNEREVVFNARFFEVDAGAQQAALRQALGESVSPSIPMPAPITAKSLVPPEIATAPDAE